MESSTQGSSVARLLTRLRHDLGASEPGDRLASSRDLVRRHQVSPVTVSRALAQLVSEGAVVTRPGAGTFVAEQPVRRAPIDHSWQALALGTRTIDTSGMSPLLDRPDDDETLSLATGYLHRSLMPTALLQAALARAARLADAWERSPAPGIRGLRAWFASGAGVEPEDVLVTPGGQGAITAVLRAVAAAGDTVLFESPTYPGAITVARAAGIHAVPVPCDEHGPLPARLAEAFERTGARAIYVQPTYRNPTGGVLAGDRRAHLLAAAADAGAFVIEDDFARWLGHDDAAPPALLGDDTEGRVVTILSLTKVASPSLRVGAVVARGPISVRLQALRVIDDLFTPRPIQEATLELVTRPGWDRHLRVLRRELRARAACLSAAVATELPGWSFTRPLGGMHLWARLPAGTDDAALAEEARRGGVVVVPGRGFFPGEAPDPHLRLTFTAAAGQAEIAEGVRRLAVAARRLADTTSR